MKNVPFCGIMATLIVIFISCNKEPYHHEYIPQPEHPSLPELTEAGFIAISNTTAFQTIVYKIDTIGNMLLSAVFNSDFLDARTDNYHSLLYLFPSFFGDMRALNIANLNTKWSVNRANISVKWFRGVELIDGELFVGDYNSFVNSYNFQKSTIKSFSILQNYYAVKFLMLDQYCFTFQKPLSVGNSNHIIVYNLGLQPVNDMVTNFEIANWFVKNENEIFIFSNSNSGSKILTFKIFIPETKFVKNISNENVLTVERIDDYKFIIATATKLLLFEANNLNVLTEKLSINNIKDIKVNNEHSKIAVAVDNQILIYDISSFNLIDRIVLNNKIDKFFWCYNIEP